MMKLFMFAFAALSLITTVAGQYSQYGQVFCLDSGPSETKDKIEVAITSFCTLWAGHVMNAKESLWTTIPMENGASVRFEIYYAGDPAWTTGLDSCSQIFKATIIGCNQKTDQRQGEAQGGNMLYKNPVTHNTVWYTMIIDPPEQINGTYPPT